MAEASVFASVGVAAQDGEGENMMYRHDFRTYIRACMAEAPAVYLAAWALSILAAAAVFTMSSFHIASLRRMPISARQQIYVTMGWMPVVFAGSALLSILAPRTHLLWWLLQQQYEVRWRVPCGARAQPSRPQRRLATRCSPPAPAQRSRCTLPPLHPYRTRV